MIKYPIIKRTLLGHLHTGELEYRFRYWIDSNTIVGELILMTNGKESFTENIFVETKYRRKGIATKLYDEADNFLKRTNRAILMPSNSLTSDGEIFWNHRNPVLLSELKNSDRDSISVKPERGNPK